MIENWVTMTEEVQRRNNGLIMINNLKRYLALTGIVMVVPFSLARFPHLRDLVQVDMSFVTTSSTNQTKAVDITFQMNLSSTFETLVSSSTIKKNRSSTITTDPTVSPTARPTSRSPTGSPTTGPTTSPTMAPTEAKTVDTTNVSSTNDTKTVVKTFVSSAIDTKTRVSAPYCEWSPENHTDCKSMIADLVCERAAEEGGIIPRRVLFLGDSTMGPGFLFKYLNRLATTNTCPQRYNCTSKEAMLCNNNGIFDLDVPEQWNPPKSGEGPVTTSPFCTDCMGCKSTFMECQILQSNLTCSKPKPMYYGGYLTVEFARDVEIQSSQYSTTQENLIKSYIPRKWNTPDLINDFNKPVCVVGTGFHDIIVPTITLNVFLENVQWYLSMLRSECSLILWLANTAPSANNTYLHLRSNTWRTYPQTQNNTLEWNEGVRDLIRRNFTEIGFVDVYKASLEEPHQDHIHMKRAWYSSLANLFYPPNWPTAC